jgi:site-specific recombinase XerD
MKYCYLEKLASSAMETISHHNYSKSYLDDNRRFFKKILEFAKTDSAFDFDEKTEKNLINYIYIKLNHDKNNLYKDQRDRTQRYIRAFRILESIHKKESIKLHYKVKIVDIPTKFKPINEEFSNWLRDRLECENTIRTKTSRLLTFFIYLEKTTLEITEITFATICDYKEQLQTYGYSEAYKANILFTLRNFLVFLSQTSILSEIAILFVGPIQSHKNSRLCSYYSMEEINLVLDQINRTTKLGKRDYLIVILILELGLRITDVIKIKLKDVLTVDNKMTLLIGKTKRLITYPLSNTLLYAIVDYLECSRNNKTSKYLFSRELLLYC